AKQIFIASTGIIGAKLPKNAIAEQLPKLRPNDWQAAAKAIMTTDTFFKVATQSFTIDGTPYHLNGIAKGSGMIAPSMATMLVFMATDAPLPQAGMQATLASVVDDTFNAITVDSDTSTSDTCLLWAPERRGTLNRRDKESFADALRRLCHDLALQVVRDGEGAQKLIEVVVEGAKNNKEAKQVAMSIANSPLVKTAIAGGDANWGRVVMAVGKSGARADRDRLAIYFGDTVVAKKGEAVANYDEAPVARHLAGREVIIRVNLHLGVGRARVWSCDLTHGYIDINADYRS
ncbi:MAG: bifunctional glutamate N-acetyltransferase/amino-acid acetyltransferase ArgJ, partial [Alphaproteobacteria bacterium]|nr:bifunctional glutamate N-acetyltransferase/amino-acid acetyltransferase ArgJ [Alphaproteobacteria bacterium]